MNADPYAQRHMRDWIFMPAPSWLSPLRPKCCVSPCPHYSDTLTKSNKAKNKEERAKSVPGKSPLQNFMTLLKRKGRKGRKWNALSRWHYWFADVKSQNWCSHMVSVTCLSETWRACWSLFFFFGLICTAQSTLAGCIIRISSPFPSSSGNSGNAARYL